MLHDKKNPLSISRIGIGHHPTYSNALTTLMEGRSLRQVELQDGNLVLDLTLVPPKIIPKDMKNVDEMSAIRYTAATCDPDDFAESYILRQNISKRQTELFIVMTMYNEGPALFIQTINAVIKNITHLCNLNQSSMWGSEGWKKVVVCIVSDGREKMDKHTLQILTVMGCYQPGMEVDSVKGNPVTAHIYESTSNVIATGTGDWSNGTCPIQILFCLKQENQGKINSHRWFFNAFGRLIEPNVCILLDVGTKPTGTSLYKLWNCFDKYDNVGGACGEIYVDPGRNFSSILENPLVASQNFEYKISNVLDKPFESNFGFISVLPGAFSAYRYKAVLDGPLNAYFKGDTSIAQAQGAKTAGLFERNMFLAEDRILCFEIVAKKDKGWILRYIKNAKASTDVPTTVPEFIYQRRRWLNGSLFASAHATVSCFRIWSSGQTLVRKICLQIEFIYIAIQLLFAWTSLANFYLAFFFLVSSAVENPQTDAFNFISPGAGPTIFEFFLKLYIAFLFAITLCSLGNRPDTYKWTYTIAMVLFGLCQLITSWCVGYMVYLAAAHHNLPHSMQTSATFRDIVVSLLTTYGLYLVTSFMYLEPWHMFTSFLQYMFLLPSYVNILSIYAMANLNDVSWGTKGENSTGRTHNDVHEVKGNNGKELVEIKLPKHEDLEAVWEASLSTRPAKSVTTQVIHDQNTRSDVVLAWLVVNMLVIIIFTSPALMNWASGYTGKPNFNPYLTCLFYVLAGLAAIRFVGSALYLVLRLFETKEAE